MENQRRHQEAPQEPPGDGQRHGAHRQPLDPGGGREDLGADLRRGRLGYQWGGGKAQEQAKEDCSLIKLEM